MRKIASAVLCITAATSSVTLGFQLVLPNTRHGGYMNRRLPALFSTETAEEEVPFDSLIDMDVVIFTKIDDDSGIKYLGALQEDGSLAPLSTWTTEPAFGESVEFLVDEEDRFSLDSSKVKVQYLLKQYEMSYGTRQCQRGVSNPHGEESELLYYVEQSVLDKFDIQVMVKPNLEILW